MSNAFTKLGEFIHQHAKMVVAVIAAFTIFACFGLTKTKMTIGNEMIQNYTKILSVTQNTLVVMPSLSLSKPKMARRSIATPLKRLPTSRKMPRILKISVVQPALSML